MNSIEQMILQPTENMIMALVDQMGPARENMAVVEPVMVPVQEELFNMFMLQGQRRNAPDDMDVDADIADDLTNDLNQPAIDVHQISLEEQELENTAELDTSSIEEKILYHHTH